MKTLLLFDLRNILFRGLHVFSDLEHNGNSTGPLYFLITKVVAECLSFETTDVVICDDTNPYFRKKLYPMYKGNREKDEEVHKIMMWTYPKVNEFLNLVGIPLAKYKGFEADDLVAVLAANYKSKYDRIIIVSNDTDLFQVLDQDNLYLLRGTGKNRLLYSKKDFKDDYPQLETCKQWAEVSAIEGGHNGLPGIDSVGPKTAISWVSGLVREKMLKTKRGELLSGNKTFIDKTTPIATIPFPYVSGSENIGFRMGEKCSERKLIQFLGHVGITYTKNMMDYFDYGY